MPAEEQIRRWEVLEFMAKTRDDYHYLVNRIPLDKEHEEWLQNRFGGTASPGSVSSIPNGSEASDTTVPESCFTSNAQESLIQSTSPSTGPFEQKYHYINIHSPSTGSWHGVIATLDTGSDENWISQEAVDRLQLDVTKGLVTKWKSFNGKTVASDSVVRATWSSRGKGVSYANVFRVVADAPFDVLFGRNLILSGEVDLSTTDPDPVLTTVHPPQKEGEDEIIRENQRWNEAQATRNAEKYGDSKPSSAWRSSGSEKAEGSKSQPAKQSKGNSQSSARKPKK